MNRGLRATRNEGKVSSLKTECTACEVYRTREQARSDVFDYIERFHNPMRRHSTLGYVSPIQFEEAQKVKPESTEPAAAHLGISIKLFLSNAKRANIS